MLAFEIDPGSSAKGAKREWLETPGCPFEKFLPEIIASIREAVLDHIELNRVRELGREKSLSEDRVRWAERARREQDERQWQNLVRIADRMEAVARVRQLLLIIEAGHWNLSRAVGGRTIGEWLAWIGAQVDKHDPSRADIEVLVKEILATI